MDPALNYQDCLCLFCRKKGHVVGKCPQYAWEWPEPRDQDVDSDSESTLPPGVERGRPYPPFNPLPTIEGALCQRCSQLDELSRIASHRPIVREDMDDEALASGEKLLSTCPLCRLIFDMTYLTDDEMKVVGIETELVLVTGWTIHRLEPDLYWKGLGRRNSPYAKCVYTSVTAQCHPVVYRPHCLVEQATEAIGLIEIGEARQPHGAPALGVRQVDPKTPNYRIIKDWLHRCEDLHHLTCRPLVSEELKQIKLINVETRQIVMYPPAGCDYIALSYVWGCVEQPSYKLGEILPTVPATLQDAMVVTGTLGKQYLWVDSLCIDQKNSVEKATQMAFMSAIYSGAWATIICLSGQSARSGLPRVGTLQDVIPQLSCEIWGKKLLSVMPTLSDQIDWSPWASRAWAYQEGLLSPRRLFFTNHQVYFECNSVQCCESLDDSSSPFHLQSEEQRRVALDEVVQDQEESDITGPEGVIGRGVLRDPFRPISRAAEAQVDVDNLAMYLRLVHSYTMREMSHDADSLNAFSAVLTRLEDNYYKRGFLQGLPVDDLPRALSWYHLTLPRRRVDFPAWSWAGWEGWVNEIAVKGAKDDDKALMPPLRIWKAGCDDSPELIYNFNPTLDIMKELERPAEEENESQDGGDDEKNTDPEENSDSSLSSGVEVISEVWCHIVTRIGNDSSQWILLGIRPDDEDSYEEINFENDPVFRLAKILPDETPAALPKINRDEMLVEGIVIQLSLTEPPDYYSDSESDDEYNELCFVKLEGQPEPQRMRFYGPNARQLVHQRNSHRQEFLLVSREHAGSKQQIYNALLLVDLDGDVASRVAVADLRLVNVELLDSCKPERRLFKLK
ncbi:heterokaryon incompatibility protein-domain-containing protein [Boletus reticuloceps]|uniref:Heterokaryon incompatibility protein-domain-containing protein n=1 Tax=Boletus reticuloceps TaxID=495285 RepID=A0A8I2Z225_9AGAM|nr:heterokaryon incompatibility protein-domain-containing protein [Boletus reticuloceps]